MDSIPILLENKNECYAMQARSQLKNSRNISMNKNEDYMKNKLLRNVEVTNKVKKKRRKPRKIIREIKLQKQIKRRDRPRKVINESPENHKKRKLAESEGESDSDRDYDIKQNPKANKKRKYFKKHEELNEGSNFETNSDLSSEDEKEEIQENFQNVEHENNNEQPDILETSGLPTQREILGFTDQSFFVKIVFTKMLKLS